MSLRQRGRAKAKLTSKLAHIRAALIEAGYDTIAKQAAALGLRRSTTWALLNQDTRRGPTAGVVRRVLSSSVLPPGARRAVEEYVDEKSRGLYGQTPRRTRAFRDALQKE